MGECKVKQKGWKQRINLPPGMKRRNPGTKKIALETPVKTVILESRHSHTQYSMQPHIKGRV